MFTKRHEQDLAEVRALSHELDQRVREALEQIKRIQKTQANLRLAAAGQRMAGSSDEVAEDIRGEIDALATRHELADGAADALQGLVRLVDWGQANFVPSSDPDAERDRRGLRAPSRRTALNLLAESLSGLELEPVRAARQVADIGSGAGFPGLVLAIALPRAHVALIEKVPERCSFLRRAAAELGLDNVEVVEADMQRWSAGVGACDLVTSRKVGRLNTMVEWSAPLLGPGGAVALWPGTTDFAEEEPAAAADAADAAGLRLAQVLPLESENRRGKRVVKHLYLYQKVERDLEHLETTGATQDRPVSRDQRRSPSRSDGADSLIAFVHIPKTAGGTVTAMLADAYSLSAIGKTGNYLTDSEKSESKVSKLAEAGWETWRRGGGRVAVGHTPYGVFRKALPPPDTRYMTILREPVDRVLSHYYRHIQRRDPRRAGGPKDLASPRVRANSLEEALVEMRLPALNNLATRFLCDDPSPEDLPASALEDAKANLREFAFLGIQERFDESIVLLQRMLDLGLVPDAGSQDRHVSIDRPTVEEIPSEQRMLIEERNQLDAELYAFAVGLFEDAVKASGEGFAAEVETRRTLGAEALEHASARPART